MSTCPNFPNKTHFSVSKTCHIFVKCWRIFNPFFVFFLSRSSLRILINHFYILCMKYFVGVPTKWISTKQHFSLDCPLVWILPFIFVFFPFQVLDAKFREAFTNVNRWFTTLVNQPQFKKVVGDFKFCDKMAEFDGNVTWGFFTFIIMEPMGGTLIKGDNLK